MDGTKSICSDTDTKRNISCREANTTLPECGKCLCSAIPGNKIIATSQVKVNMFEDKYVISTKVILHHETRLLAIWTSDKH